MIVLLIGLHVHTEWICVREKGAERLVELLVDGDEAAEILDAELDAVYLGQIVQVLPDFFERDRHITTPFYHLSEVQHRTEVWSSYSADLSRNHAENSIQKAEKLAMIGTTIRNIAGKKIFDSKKRTIFDVMICIHLTKAELQKVCAIEVQVVSCRR